jgi:CheY-like chemotaxis protein
MPPLKRLLVVENEPKDMKLAADIARSIGVPEVDGRTTFDAAKVYLDRGLNGEGPLPDGIVLDLDLGHDSGYELLRYWHSTPKLSDIPLIVWSILGEEQRNVLPGLACPEPSARTSSIRFPARRQTDA